MGMRGFEERLSAARKDKGYTQEELAVRLGVTPMAISKWERGMSYPDIESLFYLSELLECSADYLLGKESKKAMLTEDGDEYQRRLLLESILAEPLVLEVGSCLVPLLAEENRSRFESIRKLRMKLATEYGVLLPLVRIRDEGELGPREYRILIYDKLIYSTVAQGESFGFADICVRLEALCLAHYDKIINRQLVQTLLDNVADRYPAVVRGLVPDKISLELLQKVLTGILKKAGSIRNLVKILEYLEEELLHTRDAEELSEIIIARL